MYQMTYEFVAQKLSMHLVMKNDHIVGFIRKVRNSNPVGWFINRELCREQCIPVQRRYKNAEEALADLNWEDENV